MYLIHNIGDRNFGSNYNDLYEILALPKTAPLSFDGVYRNVYQHRDLLCGRDITIFVTGAYVGKNNEFDSQPVLEEFCDWNQIMELHLDYGWKLGWHSWSHIDLTTLKPHEVHLEVKPPFIMDSFAYPYGRVNKEVAGIVSRYYKEAYSVDSGDGSEYQKKRKYLNW